MPTVQCSVCRKEHEEYAVTRLGDYYVCSECKPVFLERFREGAPLSSELVYKGFWIRAGAKLIDGIVLWGAGLVLGLLRVLLDEGAGTGGSAGILSMVLGLGYVTFFLGRYGATPGKMACGIKVVRSSGEDIGYARAFGRVWAEWLSSLILGIGYIMAAFDDEKRALHDHICDTRVVKARS
jgi:uncharacterized RDD family membrane protein YckC